MPATSSIDSVQPDSRHEEDGPSHEAMEQAAHWYALLISGEADATDRARWQTWLAANAQHRHAWTYVEAVSQRVLAPLQDTPDPTLLASKVHDVHTRERSRRRVLAGLGAVAGLGLIGWTGWTRTPIVGVLAAWTADYRSGIGDIREIKLADGSRIWLNAGSALNADMSANLRKLTLIAGEVLVSTAHGDARPFIVGTPQGQLRALGTRFTVRREPEQTFLAVYEGAVEIRTAASDTTTVIAAGKQARFSPDRIADATEADPAREAWSRGDLVAWDLSLAAVVHELNRYYTGHIALDPAVAQRRVFGTFPLRDVDGALAMLADVASLQVRKPLPWWISISSRDATPSPAQSR
ncbi:FecR family protein [Bordetella genomosp. 4]|nr:FecR family protein [Bordetella genomosp. 4]